MVKSIGKILSRTRRQQSEVESEKSKKASTQAARAEASPKAKARAKAKVPQEAAAARGSRGKKGSVEAKGAAKAKSKLKLAKAGAKAAPVALRRAAELRASSAGELVEELKSLRHEMLVLRFTKAQGGLEDSSRIRKVRRAVARTKTILSNLPSAENR